MLELSSLQLCVKCILKSSVIWTCITVLQMQHLLIAGMDVEILHGEGNESIRMVIKASKW